MREQNEQMFISTIAKHQLANPVSARVARIASTPIVEHPVARDFPANVGAANPVSARAARAARFAVIEHPVAGHCFANAKFANSVSAWSARAAGVASLAEHQHKMPA